MQKKLDFKEQEIKGLNETIQSLRKTSEKTSDSDDITEEEKEFRAKKEYEKYKRYLTNFFTLGNEFISYKLMDMIKDARDRIVITVPAINKRTLNNTRYGNSILNEIKSFLERNKDSRIIILAGNGSENWKTGTQEAKDYLNNELSIYGERVRLIIDFDNPIHDKCIVADYETAMVGSFNMLSNQGIYGDGRSSESMRLLQVIDDVRDLDNEIMMAVERRQKSTDKNHWLCRLLP